MTNIEIIFDEENREEVAEALRAIADKINEGYNSGIVGYSNVNWNVSFEDERDSNADE